MRISRIMRVLLWMMLPALACASTLRAGTDPAGLVAGDESGGWLVAPFTDKGGVLLFLPAAGPPGSIVSAQGLPTYPAAMASLDGRLVMVFDPVVASPDAPARLRQVREVRATPGPRVPMQFFSEPSPLPPIEVGGVVEGLALTHDGPMVVLGPQHLGEPRRLLELGVSGWVDAAAPGDLDLLRPFQLLALDGAAVIAQDRSDSVASLWIRDQAPPEAVTGSVPQWREDELGAIPPSAQLISARGQVLALATDGDGADRLMIARAERWFDVAEIERTSDRRWVVPVGNAIVVVTSTLADPTRFACTVLTPGGEVVYKGPAQTVGPVGRRELEVLGLLLASLLLTIAVFVFRPAGADRISVTLPEGYALADPWKRIVATTIDAAIAVLLSSLMWGVPLRAIVDLAMAVTGEHGVWPIVTAGGILTLISAVGEATTGRTPGKWMMGCRTVASSGDHPSWGQAIARNAVKTLCPPLAAVSLNVPGQQSPAAFGTFVITRGGGPPADGKRGPDTDADSAPPT